MINDIDLRPGSPQSSGSGVGTLMLDSSGVVLGAGINAEMLWNAPAGGLSGKTFSSLFEFEILCRDPDVLAAQWEALREAAKKGPLALQARPFEQVRPVPVSVTLEESADGKGGFLAKVSLSAAPASTAPARRPAQPTPPARREVPTNRTEASSGFPWELLLENGATGFFDLDFRSHRIFYSPAWKKMLGYADEELPNTYETWNELIHPDDSAAAPDKLRHKSMPPGAHSFALEFRLKHREGRWLWVQCLGVRVIGDFGELERVCGQHIDITERKELEESGVLNEERLQSLSARGSLGVFDFDFSEGKSWLSPSWKKLIGYEPAELPDTEDSFLHSLPDDDRADTLCTWFAGKGTAAEPILLFRTSLRHKDGRWLKVLVGGTRYFSKKHELLRIVGFCCPAEEPLARQTASVRPLDLYKESLGALAEGILLADAKGRLVFANETALRLLRKTLAQVTGQALGCVFQLVHAASGKQVFEDPCELALSAETPLPLNRQHALAPATADGAATPIVWSGRALYDEAGKAGGVVIVFRDPEELTLTPEELVKANRFESLALLAGGVAHDFNNLLTTILGGISLAKDSHDSTGLEASEKACLTAKALTKQLLAFAKGSTGLRAPAHPGEMLADAVKIAAAGSTAQVTVRSAEGLPPLLVDRSQIIQVFQNLIVNSLQAMPPPPHKAQIAITVDRVTLAEGQIPPLNAGAYVRFDVRDNGSGIKPELLDRIWDPFFTTKKHGTGLGLATVLSIVRKHGGQIGVESVPGAGTVFTVFLPSANQPVELQTRKPASLRYGTGRVLFMDDDPNISALTAGMLRNLEYKYDLARNGEEAVKLYRSYFNIGRPYDVVILDLTVIGGMSGEDAFKAIREIDPEVRAIAASGYDNEDMSRRYLDLGFSGYLTKPYRVTDLGKIIKSVIT